MRRVGGGQPMGNRVGNDQAVVSSGIFRTGWPFAGAMLVLLVGCWLSTGTLAPYAATQASPLELPCGYLANTDHFFHLQPFLMLEGAPPEQWQSALMLRRILYPLLAWPLVATLGILWGGLLINVLLTVAGVVVWILFIYRREGRAGAIASAWLLATYPGIMYWVGLPYSYAVIVPATLVGCIGLFVISEESCSLRQLFLLSSGIGVLFIAYDGLLNTLVPAALWILWRQRGGSRIPLALVGLVWPTVLTLAVLHWGLGVRLDNSNSQTYRIILDSWLHIMTAWPDVLQNVAHLPLLAIRNYFYSNFFFLPLSFLVFHLLMRRCGGRRYHVVEEGIMVATVFFFLFLNLAPHYPGWQMRGEWIARLYQPVFVVFVVYLSRGFGRLPRSSGLRRMAVVVVGATVLANGWIVFGGLHGSAITDLAYQRFYQHTPPFRYSYHLEKYGIRPLGFCRQP